MAIHKVDGVDGTNHFPKKFVRLYASEAITKGMLVALDLSDTTNGLGSSIRPADVATDAAAGGGQPIVVGIATETVSAAEYCKVQTAGKFVDATVHTSTAAGDSLYASIVAGTAYPQAEAYAGVNQFAATGVNADTNITATGALTTDEIISFVETDTGTDRTATASFTSDGNIQNSVATNSNMLLITWRRNLNKIGYALEADTGGAADIMILDQGLF